MFRYSCRVTSDSGRTPGTTELQVREALTAESGSVTAAAKRLGVHRTTVHRLIRDYGIEVRREVITTPAP